MTTSPPQAPFVVVEVPGPPVAKGRARSTVARRKGGRLATTATGAPIIRHYTPEKTRQWESGARLLAKAAMRSRPPATGPMILSVVATLGIPPSWPKWKQQAALDHWVLPTDKPDLDNLVKAAKDALNGVVWVDDSQVVGEQSAKRYGSTPGVKITVHRVGKAPANVTSKRQAEELCPGFQNGISSSRSG